MTKTGPRDDTQLAAIKLEWWPRSDWNRWPPSLESAHFMMLKYLASNKGSAEMLILGAFTALVSALTPVMLAIIDRHQVAANGAKAHAVQENHAQLINAIKGQ